MAWESDPEDFSAAATIVPFDPPLPLLRGPVNAGPGDDPSAGSFVLTFRDAASWRSAYRATESKIVEQSRWICINEGWCSCWLFNQRLQQVQDPLVENYIRYQTNGF